MRAGEARLKTALEKLGAVVAEVVTAAEARSQTRCPYKTAMMLCTFRGGCQSQRPEQGNVRCAGDQFLLRTPR